MNEHIDLAFIGAKALTKADEQASIIVHSMSAFYNIAQIARYRSLYFQAVNSPSINAGHQEIQLYAETYRTETIKHSVLAGLDILTLLIKGLSR